MKKEEIEKNTQSTQDIFPLKVENIKHLIIGNKRISAKQEFRKTWSL